MKTMTRDVESTVGPLLMAFELGQRWWKLGFTTGVGQRPRTRRVAAGAMDVVLTEIVRAQARFRVSVDAPVISCYAAGRDGFWLHRYLLTHGVTNYVVDSSSIEVNRRARRNKTDKLDLSGLLTLLARFQAGDRRCWRVVRVPSAPDEDARQLHRTREVLQGDRTRLINRLKATLATLGLRLGVTRAFPRGWPPPRSRMGVRYPAGPPSAWRATGRSCRPWSSSSRRSTSSAPRYGWTDHPHGGGRGAVATPARGWPDGRLGLGDRDLWLARDPQWAATRGVGRPRPRGVSEWRGVSRLGDYARRESTRPTADGAGGVGLAALAAHQCAEPAVRAPIRHGRRRLRRIGIVALARKLLVAFWRYVDHGVVPEGAVLKAPV